MNFLQFQNLKKNSFHWNTLHNRCAFYFEMTVKDAKIKWKVRLSRNSISEIIFFPLFIEFYQNQKISDLNSNCKVRTFWEVHIIWKKSSSWFVLLRKSELYYGHLFRAILPHTHTYYLKFKLHRYVVHRTVPTYEIEFWIYGIIHHTKRQVSMEKDDSLVVYHILIKAFKNDLNSNCWISAPTYIVYKSIE